MSWFLYKTAAGHPECLAYRLPPGAEGGHTLVRELAGPVQTAGMVFDENNNLVPEGRSYAQLRRQAYPEITDQLDALWHAMDNGTLPKAEPFYSDILAVKQAFPKPSN